MRSDGEILEKLYDRYENHMFRVAFGILKQKWQAEDAVQDAFVKLMQYTGKIRDINCEETRRLVLRVIKTTAIDYYRKNQKEAVRLSSEKTAEGQRIHAVDEMEKAENRQIIHRILKELPTDYLEIIKLRCYFEFTNREAGQILGISEDAAAKRFERAKRYVQERTGGAENGKERVEDGAFSNGIG
ncbi:MAG: RNA polymerase sigma factor [Ruminococcus sp.]|jgi:RNA polymerase sigma-70 factor (ECF subfamily)